VKYALVFTTINAAERLLHEFAENLRRFKRTTQVEIIIIGDRKTPQEIVRVVKKTNRQVPCTYLDIPQQLEWLSQFPGLAEIIPYNSDNRRNIGYLMAAGRGADVLISIDDDNYPLPNEDYIGGHSIVGQSRTLPQVKCHNHWVNICEFLECQPSWTVYPRGFPYSRRFPKEKQYFDGQITGRVAVNAGLWLNSPDVDAISRLATPVVTTKLLRDHTCIPPGYYTPIDSQNTAVLIEALPAYYFVLQGWQLDGMLLDRYGDIWQGFFLKLVTDHIGDLVCVGSPVTNHERNIHNPFSDLKVEFKGMQLGDMMAELLEKTRLTQTASYADATIELATRLPSLVRGIDGVSDELASFAERIGRNMVLWTETCRKISKKGG